MTITEQLDTFFTFIEPGLYIIFSFLLILLALSKFRDLRSRNLLLYTKYGNLQFRIIKELELHYIVKNPIPGKISQNFYVLRELYIDKDDPNILEINGVEPNKTVDNIIYLNAYRRK